MTPGAHGASCVVSGLFLGVVEILFGIALYRILSYYDLLPNALPSGFEQLAAAVPPVPTLIVLALVIFVVRGAVSAYADALPDTKCSCVE